MSTAAFPAVISAIFTVSDAAVTGANTVRGRDGSDDPDDVVMIGVQEPETLGYDSAGTFQQTMQTFGGGRQETGTVYGLISTFNGEGDAAAALSAVFGHLADLEVAIRADPTLGLTGFEYVDAELHAGDISEAKTNDQGAIASLSFSVDYKIRI